MLLTCGVVEGGRSVAPAVVARTNESSGSLKRLGLLGRYPEAFPFTVREGNIRQRLVGAC